MTARPPDDRADATAPGAPAGDQQPSRAGTAIGSRVATSAGLLWALSMFQRGLTMLTTLVLARLLVPADFGVVALATAFVGAIEVMTNIQANTAIIREGNPDRPLFDTAFTLNLLRGIASGLLLAIAAEPLARFMDTPALAPVLYVLIIPTVLLALSNPYFILYARDLNFRFETRRRAIAAIAAAIAAIGLALAFRSYWALVAGTIVQSVVLLGLSYWRVPGRPGFSLARWRQLFGFGSWLLVQQLLQYAGLKFDYFFIGRVLDPATLGAYHVGNQVNNMATGDMLPVLGKALYPAFSMIQDEPERLRRNYLSVQSVAAAIALPAGVGLALLAEPLVYLLLGRGWDLAIPVIQIMAPLLALQSLGAGVEGMAMALGRTRTLAVRQGIYIAIRTAMVVAGWYLGGFIGLLIGRGIAGILYPAYNLWLGATLTGGRLRDLARASWRSFAAAGLMAGALWLLPDRNVAAMPFLPLAGWVALLLLAGGLTYLGCHLLLWHVSGRPDGAERLILAQLGRATRRIRTQAP